MPLLSPPIAGLDRGFPLQKQPPFSSPSMLNWIGRDSLQGRNGGGSRPGLAKAFQTRLGAVTGATPGSASWTPLTGMGRDGYLDSGSPATNHEGGAFVLGYTGAGKMRPILRFDLTSATAIPHSTTVISSASLRLYCSFIAGGAISGVARRVRRTDWVEAEVSWDVYMTANNWTTAGCSDPTNDYDATDQATFSVSSSGFLTISGLAALVQEAVDSGTHADQVHLQLIADDETSTNYAFFNASEAGSNLPTLTVNYTTGVGTSTDGSPIRMAEICQSLNSEGSALYSDEYAGVALSADWTAGSFTLDSVASSAAPAVADGYATTNLAATTADLRSAILATQGASTAVFREVTLGLDAAPTNSGLPASSYAYIFMDQRASSPDPTHATEGGIYAKFANLAAGGHEVILYMNGSEVARTTRSPGLQYLNPTCRVTIDATETARVYFSSATVADIEYTLVSYTPAGDRVGFGLRENVGGVNGGDVRSNYFAFRYSSATGGDPKNMAMFVSNGLLSKENLAGTLAPVSSLVTLANDRYLSAAGFEQRLYIADYGKAASGNNGVLSYSIPSGTLTDTSASFVTAGVTSADYRIEILPEGGVGTTGVYEITSVTATTIVFTGDAGTVASGVFYRVCRCAKVYDASTGQLTKVQIGNIGTGDGQFPLNASHVARFGSTLVWSRDSDYPQYAWASTDGDADSYIYGATAAGSAFAWDPARVAGSSAIGDAVTCLIPFRDDGLIFGCRNSIFIQRGRPPGGRLDLVTSTVGIVGPRAWCKLPDGSLVIMTTDGLYRIAPTPGAVPLPLSRDVLPLELLAIQTEFSESDPSSGYDVLLEYDVDLGMVHIYVSPRAPGATQHWLYDPFVTSPRGEQIGAFFPISLSSDMDPTSLVAHTPQGGTRTIFVGDRDGYVRIFNSVTANDDGTAFLSRCMYGPFALSRQPDLDGTLKKVFIKMMTGSDDVRVYAYVGNSAEDAVAATRVELTEAAIPVDDGDAFTLPAYLRGTHACIELERDTGGIWAASTVVADTQALGTLRVG